MTLNVSSHVLLKFMCPTLNLENDSHWYHSRILETIAVLLPIQIILPYLPFYTLNIKSRVFQFNSFMLKGLLSWNKLTNVATVISKQIRWANVREIIKNGHDSFSKFQINKLITVHFNIRSYSQVQNGKHSYKLLQFIQITFIQDS